jgi:uncharacterized protein (DUF1501 family)
MFVLGGRVHGGKFYGSWPGLNSNELEEGVDLAVTTDYRRVLTEVVSAANGHIGSDLFPNYRYPGKLGLV